ncbi:MAG: hypothetical protein NUV77_06390 [Thermoguttaceae bacterium]|jgi:hypothetical protein|nr:hypothetical protein [Thermoguttaceae bacterium]
MTQELWHTSAPRGLKPGTRGFCTVVSTQGMPLNLAERLELLSGYRHLEAPRPDGSDANPVAWNHVRLVTGGRHFHVLSRIASAGLDYSGRSNKFAHHVVLEPHELPAAGPAWLVAQPGFMETCWDGQLNLLARGRSVPPGDVYPSPCRAWQEVAGDAGWAGRLAETIVESAGKGPRTVYLIVPRGLDVLALFGEAVALLPAKHRWEATFSTFYLPLPGDVDCRWRAVYEDTPEAQTARRQHGAWCLDLTRPLPVLEETQAVVAARQGKPLMVEPVPPTPAASAGRSFESPTRAARQFSNAPEEPPALVSPPVVVPPPLAARRAEVLAEEGLGRARRRPRSLTAALLGLALGLFLGAGAVVLWGLTDPGAIAWLGGPSAGPERQEGQPAQTAERREPPSPNKPASGSSPASPRDTAPPRNTNEPSQAQPSPASQRLQPALASETASAAAQAKGQSPASNGAPHPVADADYSRNPAPSKPPSKPPTSPSSKPQVSPEDKAQWCQVVAKPVAPAASDVQGGGQRSSVLFKLPDGQSIESIELKAIPGYEARLRTTPEESKENVWKILRHGGSALAADVPLGEFRLNDSELVCRASQELPDRLRGHIAVIHLKKGPSTSPPIALQFFPPAKGDGPVRLTPGSDKTFDVPIDVSSNLPRPRLDIDTLELGVKPEKDFRVERVEEADPKSAPETNVERVSRYLVRIGRVPPSHGDSTAAQQLPPSPKLALLWETDLGNLKIAFEPASNSGNPAPPNPPSAVSELIVKKARVFLEVEGYRVALVEISQADSNAIEESAPANPEAKRERRKEDKPGHSPKRGASKGRKS